MQNKRKKLVNRLIFLQNSKPCWESKDAKYWRKWEALKRKLLTEISKIDREEAQYKKPEPVEFKVHSKCPKPKSNTPKKANLEKLVDPSYDTSNAKFQRPIISHSTCYEFLEAYNASLRSTRLERQQKPSYVMYWFQTADSVHLYKSPCFIPMFDKSINAYRGR